MIAIGFDSGGTHTTYALEHGQGAVWPDGNECADSISNARSDASTRTAIRWIMNVIAQQKAEEICAWIGAAGFYGGNAAKYRALFDQFLVDFRETGKNCDIFMANDAVSLLKAPPLFGVGVVAIVGTGSVVLGAHPSCPEGIIKRGGHEWLVSDEGAGVWMTLQCVRMLLQDVQSAGPRDYHSPLLDRLCEYFAIDSSHIVDVRPSYRALSRAELLAHTLSEGRTDAKRRIAGFVYPHIFDLAAARPGGPQDHIAAKVLSSSVEVVANAIKAVCEEIAAYTADSPNAREKLPVVVAGNIAANPAYKPHLVAAVSQSRYVDRIDVTRVGSN